MLSFETLVKYVFQELPTQERHTVWEVVKEETVYLEDLETIELLKEKHRLRSARSFLTWARRNYEPNKIELDELAQQELIFAKLMSEVLNTIPPNENQSDELLAFLPEKSRAPVSFGTGGEKELSSVLAKKFKGHSINQIKRLYQVTSDIVRELIIKTILETCSPAANAPSTTHVVELLKQYLDQDTSDSDRSSIWAVYFASNPVL